MDDAELIGMLERVGCVDVRTGIDGGQQGRWHFPGVMVTVRAGVT